MQDSIHTRKAVSFMKCPKCDITLPENTEVCPLCHAPVKPGLEDELVGAGRIRAGVTQDTGRFSAIDPAKETYDFDLQYTLTFKDAGEIRQAIADMDLGLNQDRSEELLHPERKVEEEPKTEHRQRSQEEMEEAAMRAAIRREKRAQGRVKGAFKSITKSDATKRMSRSEREKAAALRAAKSRRIRSELEQKKSKGLMLGTGVAVVVIAVIIGAINLFANMMDGEVHYPTIYTKGNQLYMMYDKKPFQVSGNLISAYAAPKQQTTNTQTSTSMSQTTKKVDPKLYQVETPTEKKLINVSADGLYTFFLENVDCNKGQGDLIYYQNTSAKSGTVISDSVYYKIQVSPDGKSVLYLKNTDEQGYHGDLYYWSAGKKESVLVDQDICTNNFVFAQDGTSALYIKNFNPIVNTGNLYRRAFGKDAAAESRMLDDKVAFVFGTTPSGKIYLYAKEYDLKTGTYNLYAMKDNEAPVLYAEKAYLPPILLKKSEAIYAYSNYHDNFQNVTYVDVATGNSNLMAEDVTRIERVRVDEGAVIYAKAYETGKSDYYIVGATENASQKIANAIVTVKENPQNRVQFDVSDDFSRVAYIGNYDETSGKGALFTLSIINGYAGTEKRISDSAYSCDVSSDGAVVRFASNYNRDTGTVSLALYENSNTVTLTEEVDAGAYTYDKTGQVMVYARNIQKEPITSGEVELVNQKGKVRKLDKGVSAYGLKKDGMILLLKRVGDGTTGELYYSNEKGNKIKKIDEGVTSTLVY